MQVGELEEHADVHFLAGCAGARAMAGSGWQCRRA